MRLELRVIDIVVSIGREFYLVGLEGCLNVYGNGGLGKELRKVGFKVK